MTLMILIPLEEGFREVLAVDLSQGDLLEDPQEDHLGNRGSLLSVGKAKRQQDRPRLLLLHSLRHRHFQEDQAESLDAYSATPISG